MAKIEVNIMVVWNVISVRKDTKVRDVLIWSGIAPLI
jgi:hypothetical protein